jgi:hypothetical protein
MGRENFRPEPRLTGCKVANDVVKHIPQIGWPIWVVAGISNRAYIVPDSPFGLTRRKLRVPKAPHPVGGPSNLDHGEVGRPPTGDSDVGVRRGLPRDHNTAYLIGWRM